MERRHFIKTATLATLAAHCDTGVSPVIPRLACAASPTPLWPILRGEAASGSNPAAAGLALGFNTYGAQALSTEAAIDAIAITGFDSIELALMPGWDTDPVTLTKQRKIDIKKRIVDSGLRLTALQEHLDDVTKPGADPAPSLERIKRALGLSRFLAPDPDHPPLLESALGGNLGWEKTRHILLARLPAWQALAEKERIVIAIKPHRGNGMTRPEHAIEVIEKLGDSPWLRINWDYSHYIFRDPPLPLVETIDKSNSRTALVTVKDTYLDANDEYKARFDLPGATGNIDYPLLFRTFHELGYRGDIQCEVSAQLWKQPGYDPLAAMKTCHTNMAAALDKAGIARPA